MTPIHLARLFSLKPSPSEQRRGRMVVDAGDEDGCGCAFTGCVYESSKMTAVIISSVSIVWQHGKSREWHSGRQSKRCQYRHRR